MDAADALANYPYWFDLENRVLVCELPTRREAYRLFGCSKVASKLAQIALKLLPHGYRGVGIRHRQNKVGEFCFFIPASMAARQTPQSTVNQEPIMSSSQNSTIITATRNGRPYLVDATRRQVLDFIEDQREAGKSVVVTSQLTNRCVDIVNIDRRRGLFAYSSQWHGINFMELWRESMSQYFEMLDRLSSDGLISGFTYELLRMDGSKGRYQKDYYLANNFLTNESVRISVSNPEDWELVRAVSV